jgi:hypothetical protein
MRSGIKGTAQVLYPENSFGAPDWRSAEVVKRTIDYLEELPPHRGQLVGALFVAADVMLPPLMRDIRQLPQVPLHKRQAAFERWYKEPFSPMGQLVGALKATLSMAYFGHPSVVSYIGTRKTCERPWDAYKVDVDVNLLVRDHARAQAAKNTGNPEDSDSSGKTGDPGSEDKS